MDSLRRLLAMLLVLVCGIFIFIWAGWYNEHLDFLGWGWRYARKFPLGPDYGPVAFGLLAIFFAYVIYPSQKEHQVHGR